MICGVFYEGLGVGRCGREGRDVVARGEDFCFTGRRNIVPVLEYGSRSDESKQLPYPVFSAAGMFG